MSYYGSHSDAAADAKKADLRIDGLSPANTSPVLDGSEDPGGAPMSGKHEFSETRTRPGNLADGGTNRRAYPSEPKATKL
jgi:hypothetical protein